MNDHSYAPQLKEQLDAFEGNLDRLLAEYSEDAAFRQAFSSQFQPLISDAAAQHTAPARGRVDCVLNNAGMILGDGEGEPCALLLGVRGHRHRTTEPQQLGA